MGAKNRTDRFTQGGLAERWDNFLPIMRTTSWKTDFGRAGGDNPKYKSLIKQKSDATNPLTVSFQNVVFEPGEYTAQWTSKKVNPHRLGKVIKTRWLNNIVPATHSLQPDVWFQDSVSNNALLGVIKKIRTYETSDFAGPTFVGELRETLSMLRSPLKALRTKTGLFTDLHMRILRDKQAKGGRFKPETWGKVISDTYLEWVFGASPLIADIDAVLKLFLEMKTRGFGNGLKRLSYRFQDSYIQHQPDVDGVWESTDVLVRFAHARTFRSSAQYVVFLDNDFIFAEQSVDNLRGLARFDLGEIVPTVWELLPWSFLVDYWTNIGDVMNCSFDFSRHVAFAKLTRHDIGNVIMLPRSISSTYTRPNIVVPTTYISTNGLVRRASVPKLGFPQLEVSLPGLGQFSNMASLMYSLQNNNPFRGHTLK